MITFLEHPDPSYALRTHENAKRADLTIAFALDFNTPGEILTRKCAYGKYVGIDIEDVILESNFVLEKLFNALEEYQPNCINFAGNGIYTLKEKGIDQERIDVLIEVLILYMLKQSDMNFSIRSGGQTGVDEAALKAGDRLGLQTTCLTPKGWLFRDASGRDIRNEVLFKKRFGPDYDLSFIF